MEHWRWRKEMAKQIAQELEPARFGVAGLYLLGSSKNGTAAEGSDLDILVHFRGTRRQERELRAWLRHWSLWLAELNYLRTGYRCSELLDVHFVTDEDIEKRTSFAVRIGATSDPALPLPLGKKSTREST